MKSKRRSVDYDGLDGILQLPETAKETPIWYQAPWLYALLVAGLAGAFLLYKHNQPTSPHSLPAQTDNTVMPQVSNHNPSQENHDLVLKNPEPNTDTPQTDSTPDHQDSPTSNENAPTQQTADLEQGTTSFQIDAPTATSSSISFTVHFKFNSSKLNLLGKSEKDNLIHAAKNCPKLIELTGHTCNIGSAATNKFIGLARANSVKKFLSANGIPVQNIAIASAGMDNPAVPNDTPIMAAKNRRVELICRDR